MSNGPSNGKHLAFPFRVGADGRMATVASDAEHVRDELLQLMLTDPGERPFLPEFGGGARRLVFEPTSQALEGVTRARVTQALQRWLGHRVTVSELEVEFAGERVDILIKYTPAGTRETRAVKFQRAGS
jgi:uncharacterized protein